MKKLITGAFIIALTIGTVQAQTTPDQKKGHRKEHRMVLDQLNLSEEQKASMQKIREDFKKKMDELKKQDQITVAEMKQRRQALHEEHKAQVAAILTPAQKEQLAKAKTERKYMSREGKGRMNKDGKAFRNRGAALQKELNLTADQQQKVEKIRSGYRTKMQALRNDNTVSQEQKKVKVKELKKQQQEKIKTVLTKEQQEKMKSLRQEQRARNTK
jgi:Spy/CpxP family protein refolding chaperone